MLLTSYNQGPKRTSSGTYSCVSQFSPIPRTSPTDLLAALPRPSELGKREFYWFVSQTAEIMARSRNEGLKAMLRRRTSCNASLSEAIAYLASACDGAVRRDGHGFSADDVAVGHRLAHKRRWTRRDQRNAHQIAVHHRRQLSWAGLYVKGINTEKVRRERNRAEAQWSADPTLLHHLRYWNGARWTAHVRG